MLPNNRMFRDEYHVETKRGTETAEGVEIFSYTVDLPVPTAPDSQRVRYHCRVVFRCRPPYREDLTWCLEGKLCQDLIVQH
jgi:hypothetical protein